MEPFRYRRPPFGSIGSSAVAHCGAAAPGYRHARAVGVSLLVPQEEEMRRVLTLGAALLCLVGLTAVAQAKAVEYMSRHPLPRKVGHGFCYIDVPHFHDFGPSDPRLYRQIDGQYYFVGDPSPFEYEGPRYAYYGAHPVVEAQVQS